MIDPTSQPEGSHPTSGTEVFRPYARLISVLGDQLITSKWVGVIELVKNSYDADASRVTVRFLGFDEPGQSPVIEIEDDGDGMTVEIIRNVWMKPATPNKLLRKKSKDLRFTKGGRLMQGDKGVGRFAIYKLGNLVEIFTKTRRTDEVALTLNFREYAQNDEFAEEEFSHKFLDEIQNEWSVNPTPREIFGEQGTLIRISDLRNAWKWDDLKRLKIAFQRMIPPIIPNFKEKIKRDFDVELLWNDTPFPAARMSFETIIDLAPYAFEGRIDAEGKLTFIYKHRNKELIDEIDLFASSDTASHDLWKLPMFREQFLREFDPKKEKVRIKKGSGDESKLKKGWIMRRKPTLGGFSFFFYAFDFYKNRLELDKEQEEFIKENSVYLYRDFTRVFPYGEKGIDWLLLSKLRAEDRAGRYFSYNDLFGFVFITQEENPDLRDQASREGLVNNKGAYDDFVALIQAALKVMKDFVDIDKRRDEIRKEKAFTSANTTFQRAFEDLKKELESVDDEKTLKKAQAFFKATNVLVGQYKEKLAISEELAGLGMAVEKSSHDVFMLITKMIQNSNDIVRRFDNKRLSGDALKRFFEDLTQSLEFLYQELQILQPLFRESRKVVKDVSVKETFERIERYYRREFQFDIRFEIQGKDFTVHTNLGLLLQVFINLVDNSIYWLKQQQKKPRRIVVQLDSEARQVIVADSGPGIDPDLSEVIFLEFFSKKADSGRGLGLYIAKELLDRINANISLITLESTKVLPGANFLLDFREAL